MKVLVTLVMVALVATFRRVSGFDEPVVIHPGISYPIVTIAVRFINDFYRRKQDFTPRRAESILEANQQSKHGRPNIITMTLKVIPGPEWCFVQYNMTPGKPDTAVLSERVSCSSHPPAKTDEPGRYLSSK